MGSKSSSKKSSESEKGRGETESELKEEDTKPTKWAVVSEYTGMRLLEKGRAFKELRELRPVDKMYYKLLSHRLYRLRKRNSSRNHRENGTVKKIMSKRWTYQ